MTSVAGGSPVYKVDHICTHTLADDFNDLDVGEHCEDPGCRRIAAGPWRAAHHAGVPTQTTDWVFTFTEERIP